MALFGLVQTKAEKEKTALKDKELTVKKQIGLAEGLKAKLEYAAKKNEIFKLDDNRKPYPNIHEIKTGIIKNNGPKSQVNVFVDDSDMNPRPLVVQIDIDVHNDRIHLLLGPYGPEANFQIKDYDMLAQNLEKYVKEYAYHGEFAKQAKQLRKHLFGV